MLWCDGWEVGQRSDAGAERPPCLMRVLVTSADHLL